MCSGVCLLKEQEMRSKCQRRNTTEHQQLSIFNQQCRCRAEIPKVSRIDGGVARQQQLHDFNVTLRGGDVQRGPFAEGKRNQKQMSEAQHNRTSAEHFQSTRQV